MNGEPAGTCQESAEVGDLLFVGWSLNNNLGKNGFRGLAAPAHSRYTGDMEAQGGQVVPPRSQGGECYVQVSWPPSSLFLVRAHDPSGSRWALTEQLQFAKKLL
jgi:hypothetical protein